MERMERIGLCTDRLEIITGVVSFLSPSLHYWTFYSLLLMSFKYGYVSHIYYGLFIVEDSNTKATVRCSTHIL